MKKHILFFHLLLLFSSLSAQQRIYVHPTATGTANGTSWTNAFTDLQLALQSATYGDTMWVAEGTYLPTSDNNRDSSFNVPNGLRLYGGFAGTETEMNQRDWTAHPVILSGNIGNPQDTADNSWNIMYLAWPDSFTVVDGFTFRFGYAEPVPVLFQDGSEPFINGGAMYIQGFEGAAYPDIRNCTFEYNYAWGAGGAVFVNGSGEDASVAPRFLNCIFRQNRTVGYGGAVYRYGGSWAERYPDFGDCLFEKNFAGQWGGGLYYFDTERTDTLHFSGCLFVENEGEQDAGAMGLTIGRIAGASMIIRNSVFNKNTTTFGNISGIRTNGNFRPLNIFMVSNTTFVNHNMTTIGLLGLADEVYSLRSLDHCSFDSMQGSIAMQAQTVIITNNNINSCDHFQIGAYGISAPEEYRNISNNIIKKSNFTFRMTVENAPLDISNNMFVENTLSTKAGFFLFQSSSKAPVIRNSTFINTGGVPQNFQPESFVDTASGDYRLSACSMLRDAGSNAGLANVPTDLAGNPRIQDGTVDIGAYETPGFSFVAPSTAAPICAETESGSITLQASSGCEPYTVTWQNGAQSGSGLSDLPAGTYHLSVTDQGGRLLRDTVQILQGGYPEVDTVVQSVVCGQTAGGSAVLLASGGQEPYSYHWANGSTAAMLTGLATGVYRVTVRDAAGCTTLAEAVVNAAGALDLSAEVGAISCFGETDGALSVLPLDGLSPYLYQWSGGQWRGKFNISHS